ncbi:tetratricopeptide repeat protein [Mucilaginibacter sp. AW1-3]
MKDVINNIAFYYKKNDLKYLADAKKSVDASFKTRADSLDLGKNVYKAVVYSSIVYIDSLNKLKQPDTLFLQTTKLVNRILHNRKIYKYEVEVNYIKGCIANVYLRKAFDSYTHNNYHSAIADFKTAKSYVPADKELNGYLGNIYYKLGSYTTAVTYYDTLLQAKKPRIEYIQSAANIYKILGDTSRALQIIQDGIADYPHDRYLQLEEANIYNNRKDYAKLRPLVDALLTDAPNDADLIFLAANCYDHLNDFKKAESLYQTAIELNSTDYTPIFNLGLLYLRKAATEKKHENYLASINQSRSWLEKASEISPNNQMCLKALQMLYLQTGNDSQLNKVNSKLKQLTNY